MGLNAYLQISDVREYLMDRSVEDNYDGDLAFSDAEIEVAMRTTAREYNGIEPYVASAQPDKLSGQTNMFLDGIIAHLYTMAQARDIRNDVEYNAGGVTSQATQRKINYYQQKIGEHRKLFRTAAQQFKGHINMRRGYGRIG